MRAGVPFVARRSAEIGQDARRHFQAVRLFVQRERDAAVRSASRTANSRWLEHAALQDPVRRPVAAVRMRGNVDQRIVDAQHHGADPLLRSGVELIPVVMSREDHDVAGAARLVQPGQDRGDRSSSTFPKWPGLMPCTVSSRLMNVVTWLVSSAMTVTRLGAPGAAGSLSFCAANDRAKLRSPNIFASMASMNPSGSSLRHEYVVSLDLGIGRPGIRECGPPAR